MGSNTIKVTGVNVSNAVLQESGGVCSAPSSSDALRAWSNVQARTV